MSGKLYMVATPIGNLEDMTLRAIRTLKEVDVIAAEDTRTTLKLLNHFEIKKPLISYHRHNEDAKVENLIEKIKNGENVAVVSDAGTPGISDPGEVIVKKAIEENIEIIPIPGACAAINALIVSGLDTKEFIFMGFLPLNKKLRKEKLREIGRANKTIIIYEAPHKLKNTLKDLQDVVINRQVVLAREITKIHEEYIRGTIEEIILKAENLKGEMIILIEGIENKVINKNQIYELQSSGSQINQENIRGIQENAMSLEEHYEFYKKQGFEKKDIIKKISKDRGVSKNEIYMKFLDK